MSGSHPARNPQIFSDLIEYKRNVFRICLGFSRNPFDAEELTQEVYLKAFKKIGTLKNPKNPRSWLFKIAKNTCLDNLRKTQGVQLTSFDAGNEPEDTQTPEYLVLRDEQFRMFKEAVNRLPRKLLTVFILREYGQLSYVEIAAVSGTKKGTVMSRLNRARAALLSIYREISDGKKE